MPPLTRGERDAFLAERGVLCRIATVKPAGAPHVTPVWYIVEDGQILITPRAESSWLAHIRRDPRVALTIDEQAGAYRKVTVEGVARVVFDLGRDDEWREVYRAIARRYVPDEAADRYIEETIDQPRALIAVPLAGSLVRGWRMPVPGEPYAGIWHSRYYASGSRMAREAARGG